MDQQPPDNQPRHRIPTYIARAVIGLIGMGLLIFFIVSKIWRTAGLAHCLAFCAVIGLFLGYGLGGDIWGARLFDLFTGLNSRRHVEQHGDRPALILPKLTLLILLSILLALLFLLIRFVWLRPS